MNSYVTKKDNDQKPSHKTNDIDFSTIYLRLNYAQKQAVKNNKSINSLNLSINNGPETDSYVPDMRSKMSKRTMRSISKCFCLLGWNRGWLYHCLSHCFRQTIALPKKARVSPSVKEIFFCLAIKIAYIWKPVHLLKFPTSVPSQTAIPILLFPPFPTPL